MRFTYTVQFRRMRDVQKFFVTLLITASIFSVHTCNAMLPPEQMYIGALTVGRDGYNPSDLYGKADKTYEYTAIPYGRVDVYDNSAYLAYSQTFCVAIAIIANNGWTTPAGSTVGMDSNVALKLYGQHDEYYSRSNHNAYIYKGKFIFNKKYLYNLDLCIIFHKQSQKIAAISLISQSGLPGHGYKDNVEQVNTFFIDEILNLI